jgi:hypothetical protein
MSEPGCHARDLPRSSAVPLRKAKILFVTASPVVKCSICRELMSRSQWPRGLRRGSETARLLRLRVRTAWMCLFLNVVCCPVEASATS